MMPRRVQRAFVGGISAPAQDQCMFPVVGNEMKDSVSLESWPMVGATYTNDDGAPAYTAVTGDCYCRIASTSTPLVLKSWTGALTILARAWGIGNNNQAQALFGDLGHSSNRGSAAGPSETGGSNFHVAESATTLRSSGSVADMFSSTPTYRDYAFIFEPSTRIAQYRDSVLMSENTANIPAARHISTLDFMVGNRGDLNDSAPSDSYLVGRVRFVFAYKKVLTMEEIEAAFNNPVYIP